MSAAAITISVLEVLAAFASAYDARQRALAAKSADEHDAAIAEMDALFERAKAMHTKLQAEQVQGAGS